MRASLESRLDYSIVHRSPVRTCECKILVRGRVTVNMRRARRRRSRLFRSDPTRPSCRAERGERGRAETASPSRAPAARGLRDPHPASAPRLPRDRCGNLRASTTTAHEQRREHAVHVTSNTTSPKPQVSSASFHPGPGTHQHIYSTVARGVWLGSRAGQRHTHHVTTAIHVQ